MAAFSDVNFEKTTNKDMQVFLNWFVQNTTDKIFARMERLNIGDTGALRNSIRGVVYSNAGGNDWLVKFYYLNYGRFLEFGLGHNRGSDADLGREGVKIGNVKVPAITSWQYDALSPTFQGQTNAGVPVGKTGLGPSRKGGKRTLEPRDRAKYHKAKPFLFNSIRAEMKRISFRMAEQIAYHGAICMTYGIVGAFDGELKNDVNYGLLAQQMDKAIPKQGWTATMAFDYVLYMENNKNK